MCIRDRPGSSENLSDANTILNTAVAKVLKGYADELEGAEEDVYKRQALKKPGIAPQMPPMMVATSRHTNQGSLSMMAQYSAP